MEYVRNLLREKQWYNWGIQKVVKILIIYFPDISIYNGKFMISKVKYVSFWILDGMVFSWGANNYGQLGAGSTQQHIDTPQALISIRGIPIAQIITGGNHSFILSMSGALFGWGRNR